MLIFQDRDRIVFAGIPSRTWEASLRWGRGAKTNWEQAGSAQGVGAEQGAEPTGAHGSQDG